MEQLVRLVPTWCWWLAALLLVAGAQEIRVGAGKSEVLAARSELADYRLEVAERDQRAAAQARQEEQRRATAQEEARAHAQEERTIADAGAAGADATGRLLRSEAAQLAAAVSCPGPDTVAIARGQAATRAAMVLSDLLARSDERAGELATALDRARIAGQQCEREYDALVAKRAPVSAHQ
ncbi:DUF2514 domain-containing protein [Pseudomonas sp. B5(2017)]|uniref:DUF2514 domain-containing protein n=1 Tax=Pseudomonas sp. B5(2017) TaxID=1981714 RepID=UPI000A1E78AA|nr:DUF2514 domain-containing protein [Pseudomonas sp. B5(2017)]